MMLTRYRVVVVKLKSKRSFPPTQEDGIFLSEGDTFYGYSHKSHDRDQFFDLWFTKDKDQDSRNFVTFGKIQNISVFAIDASYVYTTKLGQFIVEEVGLASQDVEIYEEVGYEN